MLERALARKLIAIRRQNQWSQEIAAELCDLSVRYWGKMERAQTSATLSTLYKLAKGLGLSVAELLDGAPIPDHSSEDTPE